MKCRYCGREFEPKKRGRMGQRYCSLSCSSKASRETFATQRTCPVCGRTFTATTPQAVYCSEECQRRATRDREQAKRRRRRNATHDQRDNHLSLAAVYQKAQGVCSVCGLPVPPHCERNDAWSMTKDHIVPITQGGTIAMPTASWPIASATASSTRAEKASTSIGKGNMNPIRRSGERN